MVINGGDMCPMFSHTVIEKETRCFINNAIRANEKQNDVDLPFFVLH